MKTLLFALVLFCCVFTGRTQDLRQIVPPSPSSQAFEKFINNKVNLANGLPEIGVNLYNIEVGGISIPIRLSYHASGIRYNQSSGDVGLGWVLNPGYRISRTIYGFPDEKTTWASQSDIIQNVLNNQNKLNRDFYLSTFLLQPDAERFLSGPNTFTDGQYDIFTLSTDQISANLLIGDHAVGKLSFLNARPGNIISYGTESGIGISHFNLTDTRGVQYSFGKYEDGSGIREMANAPGEMNPTSWPLTRILTPAGKKIQFGYTKYTESRVPIPTTTVTITKGGDKTDDCYHPKMKLSENQGPSSYYESCFPTTITTEKEKVVFIRTAVSGILNEINIRTIAGDQLIRKIQFYYSYGAMSNRYLDSVRISDPTGVESMTYSFDYHNRMGLCLDYDLFGYYKSAYVQSTYLASLSVLAHNFEDELPDGTLVGACNASEIFPYNFGKNKFDETPDHFTLQKITYPTGGYTTYMYEANKYKCGENVTQGAGLRVKRVESFDHFGKSVLQKTYNYGPNGNGAGIGLCFPPRKYDVQERLLYGIFKFNFTPLKQITYSSLLNSEVLDGMISSSWLWYNEVSEESVSSNGSEANGKIIEKYDRSLPQVATYSTRQQEFGAPLVREYEYDNEPRLLERSVYKSAAAGGGLVSQQSFEYTPIFTTLFSGLKVAPYIKTIEAPVSPGIFDYYLTGQPSVFNYDQYYIKGGHKLLSYQLDKTYGTDGSITETKKYFEYTNGRLLREKTFGSDGKQIITEYKYAGDFEQLTASDDLSAGVKSLTSKNILDAEVEKTSYRSNADGSGKVMLSTLMTSYYPTQPFPYKIHKVLNSAPVTGFVPASISGGALAVNSGYVPLLVYSKYDADGNLLEQYKENNFKNSYIWDYAKQYPIAEVTNAGWNEIAYTSFEADGTGNWLVASAIRTSGSSITGNKHYLLQNGAIVYNGLAASKRYIVTFWLKNGASASINNTTSSSIGLTSGEWTFHQRFITGATSITIQGSGGIDEVRMFPEDAQMNTFTYSPLIGTTAQAGITGIPAYFEYDGLGRLTIKRDAKRQITQQLKYGIRQDEFGATFSNNAASGNFFRNNCSGGFQGSQVTYLVPAGKYISNISQADADAKAQADIQANGQNFANTNGTCPPGFANSYRSQTFYRNNCPAGTTAGTTLYIVPAGKYVVYTSQAAADALAQNEINTYGQATANTNASCYWFNQATSGYFTKYCTGGLTGTTIGYSVPAGKYSSAISQADANAKAQADLESNGQQYANDNGTCGNPNFYVRIKNGPVSGGFGIRIKETTSGNIVVLKDFMGNESGVPAFAASLPTGINYVLEFSCSTPLTVSINGQDNTISGVQSFSLYPYPFVVEVSNP
ncbi:DUF5977 domain-containing protein [Chitinophaga rhizosphaerae]|uniref:DUF5977 domain-containing protein n=1 Tax=Chitinophaga rhizosphaerae TaxID=1864947 RepID=UPI000F7FEF3D|nr:DUF5977 domain-containing protein [Chitinophaga rhizosphaerae]